MPDISMVPDPWYILNTFSRINKRKLQEKIDHKRKVEIDEIENKI